MEYLTINEKMKFPVLQELSIKDRREFLDLYHVIPHLFPTEKLERYKELSKRVDFQQLELEKWQAYARKPSGAYCWIIRDPYILRTGIYGKLILPDELVPPELRELPTEDYIHNIIHATKLTAELFTLEYEDNISGVVTSFVFDRYVKNYTEEELKEFFPDGPFVIEFNNKNVKD